MELVENLACRGADVKLSERITPTIMSSVSIINAFAPGSQQPMRY